MQFSKRLDRFGEEIFAALNNRRMELEQQGMKIYNMSVGTPDFKTPEHIKKALAEAAMDDNNWKVWDIWGWRFVMKAMWYCFRIHVIRYLPQEV